MKSSRAESDDNTGWAALQYELLVSIMDLLTPAEQVFFSTVCSSWCLAFMAGGCSRPPPQAPWLHLCFVDDPDDDNIRNNQNMVDDINDDDGLLCFERQLEWNSKMIEVWDGEGDLRPYVQVVRFPQPEYIFRGLLGMSPDGWLFMIDDYPHIWAINPITREQILLPPPPPNIKYIIYPESSMFDHSPLVAMSSPWDDVQHKMFAVSFALPGSRRRTSLALARQGAPEWSTVNFPCPCEVMSMTYSRGEFFVLIVEREDLCILSVGACQPPLEPRVLIRLEHGLRVFFRNAYLLVSNLGDKVFLCNISAIGGSPRCFQLDVGDGEASLVRLHSLGLNTLFIGDRCSFMIPMAGANQENLVYFWNYDFMQCYNFEDGQLLSSLLRSCVALVGSFQECCSII